MTQSNQNNVLETTKMWIKYEERKEMMRRDLVSGEKNVEQSDLHDEYDKNEGE